MEDRAGRRPDGRPRKSRYLERDVLDFFDMIVDVDYVF
jgi:hypothetical protein